MNEISQKNEDFLIDELRILNNIDELKLCKETILGIISQYKAGITKDKDMLNTEFDKALYHKTKIDDTASSINMYAANVFYESEDLMSYENRTLRNAHIANCTIPSVIDMKDVIDDFGIDITNLGFADITTSHKVLIRMYTSGEYNLIEYETYVNQSVVGIGSKQAITISSLPCPTVQNEYTLDIELSHDEDKYARLIVYGISVIERGFTLDL